MKPQLYARCALTLLVVAASPALGFAQANFAQSFDNVAGGTAALVTQGFAFRDQSTAVGQWWWNSSFQVDPGSVTFHPHTGAGFLGFGGTCNLQADTTTSAWVILPPIPAQIAGDVLSFHARGYSFVDGPFSGPAVVEVRYSTSGATSTGSSSTSVGDFTTLLTSFVPAEGAPYINYLVSVPGNGRLALRVTGSAQFGDCSPFLLFDSLQFNPPPPAYPLPLPGQTVAWTAAMSPIQIATDVSIQAGGTVLVDPGVEIRVADGRKLEVLGTLVANGTSVAPVYFTQVGASGELTPSASGRIDLRWSIVDLYVHPHTGTTIQAAHCTFTSKGSIVNVFDGLGPSRSVLRLDNCVFQGSTVQMGNLMAALRGVDFQQQTIFTDVILYGYVLLDGVSVDGTTLWLGKEKGIQPIFVDSVTVRNSTAHGGLYLQRGTNFLLGPNNVLQNNRWPVEFGVRGAGLLPQSVVPVFGNIDNFVMDTDDFDPQSNVTWGGLAVPYVVRMQRFLGAQRVLPGARIQFMPNTGWTADSFGNLDARGTAGRPIVFERFDPGFAWRSIELFNPTSAQRLEHCVFKGANRAVVSSNAQIDSCRFESCSEGVFSGEAAWTTVRKSEFISNTIGINGFNPTPPTDGSIQCGWATNPNSFTGNGLAVQSSVNSMPNTAEHNWWGHSSGPYHPVLNPAGQGDPILALGGGTLPFLPVAVTAPNFADAPPHVAWLDGRSVVCEPGTTLLLTFAAHDDSAILSQRLLFSPNNNTPGTMQQIATLAPVQRTVAFTVPSVGTQINGVNAFLRIESFDDQGQMGYDELELFVIDPSVAGTLSMTTNYSGTHRPGDSLGLTFTTNGVSPVTSPAVYGRLQLDSDRRSFSLGGANYSLGSLGGGVTMPEVSTDRARVVMYLAANQNRQKWVFSEPFSIRPDALLGDAPPAVSLFSPLLGNTYVAGSTIPIRWVASDDEGVRSCDIQVTTDAGRSWNLAAVDLPGSATAYDWALPAGIAFEDVRVRVVAHDKRFQNSADGDSVSFRIAPLGCGGQCVVFCSGDGSSSACPCGNSGANGNGCASSVDVNGARLSATGSASLANDIVVLAGSGMPNSSCLYIQGTTQTNPAFGDGLLCVGGSVARIAVKLNVAGASQYPAVGDAPLAALGGVVLPGTRTYQIWYRDAVSFCTAATFNLSNGVEVAWTP